MNPLVSVIVPAYNYAHFLGQTFRSLQHQTYSAWECIIVDDGSTDRTWDVALEQVRRDRRFKYIRRGNGGLSAARNTGIRAASGAYVQFLDADDLLEPRKLATQVEYLEHYCDTGIVYGNVSYFDSKTGARRWSLFGRDAPWMPQISGSGDYVLRALIRANIMVVNAPLVRYSVVDKVGSFDESLTSLEDWDYWIRCARAATQFSYLDCADSLSLVRVHGSSMSHDRIQMLQQQIRIRKGLQRVLTGDLSRLNKFWLSEDLGQLASILSRDGERFRSALRFVEASWTRPSPGGLKWVESALCAVLDAPTL